LHHAYNITPDKEDHNNDGNNRSGKISQRRKEGRNGKKLKSSCCGKTETDGEALFSNNPLTWEIS
jgi:hypothetical protein